MAKLENRAQENPQGGPTESKRSATKPGFEQGTALQVLPDKQRLQNVRDLVLLFLPTIYVLGYVTWAINALQLRLGMLPVIDQQYFIAGIFPFFVVLCVFLLFKVSNHYAEVMERSLPERIRLVQLIIRVVICMAAGAFIIGTIFAPERTIGLHRAKDALLIEVITLLVAALFCFVFPSRVSPSKKRRLRLHTVLLPTIVFLIGTYLAAIGLSYVPNALGGLQPRCALLDLSADTLAPQTLADLGLMAPRSEQVFRTPRAVQVIFMTGPYIVLRISEKASYPVEIKADSILFITWQACDGLAPRLRSSP